MEHAFDYGPRGRVIVVRDPAALAQRAIDLALTAVSHAQAARHWAYVVLSGGSTPRQMGELLAREPYRDLTLWHNLRVFWGDERWVPLKSDESNAGVMKRIFLDHVPIPAAQVHPMPTACMTPAEAAQRYEELICELVPAEGGVPRFSAWARMGIRHPCFLTRQRFTSGSASLSRTMCHSLVRRA